MKTVIFYENTPEGTMEKLMEVFPAHEENEEKFIKSGKILGSGPFSEFGTGAMAIFTDRQSAEEFVKGDPFVQQGFVSMKDWHDEML